MTTAMQPVAVTWPEVTGRNNVPLKNSMMNALAALAAMKVECSFDVFLGKYYVQNVPAQGEGNEVSDRLVRLARRACHAITGYEPGKDALREAMMAACEAHTFNSLQDRLLSLTWDGKPRLAGWLTTYLGVKRTPLHDEWGGLFICAAIRRAFDPGTKWDQVLSLEGPEGVDKSTACKVLAFCDDLEGRSGYFSDSTILDKQEKEQMELSRGVWIYELSEMSGASRADQKKLKAFVVRQEDRAREAYAYFRTNQPRSAVFIATINTDANSGQTVPYLNAGDRRRWWPVLVGEVAKTDVAGLLRDRDQLYAEAMACFFKFDPITGELYKPPSLKLDPKFYDDGKAEQIEREIPDTLADWLGELYGETLQAHRSRSPFIAGVEVKPGIDFLVRPDQGDVWLSSAFLSRIVPHALTGDSRRITSAMSKNEWRAVNDRRRADKLRARGYSHSIAPGDLESDEVAPAIAPEFSEFADADLGLPPL